MTSSTRKILSIILFILGAYMIYLGAAHSMLPPAITGVGFAIIALIFFRQN